MTVVPVLAFVVPFASACLAGAVGLVSRRGARVVAIAALVASFLLSLAALIITARHGPLEIALAGWPPPLGIEWVVDPASALMATLISGLALVVLGGSGRAIRCEFPRREGTFYACSLLMVSGLKGMLFTADLFNLFVCLELVSLTAYGLVGAGERGAPAAALRYLVFGSLGASLYLLGVGYVYAETGTLNSSDVATRIAEEVSRSGGAITFGCVLVVVGFAVKMALFPLHGWMAPAYATAPPTAAALMAPLVTKVAAFVLIRLLHGVLKLGDVPAGLALSDGLVWMGAATIIAGGILAFQSDDIRRMLAYSSISQMGLVAVGIGLATPKALAGALFSILADSVAKGALFLAASDASHRFRTSRVTELSGLRGRAPWITATMIVCGISIIGLPPLGGFFGKWYVIVGSLEDGRHSLAAVVVLGGLISAAYVFRLVERLGFSGPHTAGDDANRAAREDARDATGTDAGNAVAGPGLPAAMLILALLVVILGLASEPIVRVFTEALAPESGR